LAIIYPLNGPGIDLAHEIASLATQALIHEVSCFPAPGLVSPVSNGAHGEMNYYTFIDSACALIKHFFRMAAVALSDRPEKEIFLAIRSIGKEAEIAMYRKTKGVNTHKGAIFVLGLSLAAVAKTLYRKGRFSEVAQTVRAMTAGITEGELNRAQLAQKARPSHGETVYLKHNLPGVRAEAEAGFPAAFNQALPLYEASSDLAQNDRLVHALLGIMAQCADTNIVYRHSPETLVEVQAKAAKIMALGGMRTKAGKAAADDLQKEFVARNISPGGSADLLGLTVFLELAKTQLPFCAQ
jgi:triphosphoribosyl-dephospho-CoA synthase